MCGITGIFRRDGQPVRAPTLARMTGQLAHRGPDSEAIWTDGAIGFGHRRLAIRDLSDAGNQPMRDPAGHVTLTYNGEVYNDDDLRRQIRAETGYAFRSTCDAETIIAGYLAWGDGVFDRLEGMFALGLWDARHDTLVLARDGVGIKPLYFRCSDDEVLFASEVKGLLAASRTPAAIDPPMLHAFLAQGYVSPNQSLIRDIGQVAPGSIVAFTRDDRSERRFWRPSRRREIRSLGDAVDAFAEVWPRVAGEMLVSDVPVGILQSGGIDSTLISEALRARPSLPLFTAQFAEPSHDESAVARTVASHTGHPLHLVRFDETEAAEETFLEVVRHCDGQLADSSSMAVYRLCRSVRDHVTVALSGDGADEFFGGYSTYRASRFADFLRLPTWAGVVSRFLYERGAKDEGRMPPLQVLARLFAGISAGKEHHPEWRRLLPRHLLPRVYGPAMRPLIPAADPLAGYRDAIVTAEGTPTDRRLLADQSFYLPSDMLMKVDAMSMAHGLEVRVPFLDRRVVDVAARIDNRLLTPLFGPNKRVLRRALQRAGLPKRVWNDRKKGFQVPVTRLLRTGLRPLADRLLDDRVDRLAPFLDGAGVRRTWREHRECTANHGYALWPVLSFAAWLDIVEG